MNILNFDVERIIGFTAASLLLLIFAPLFFFISIMILLLDGYPVFYSGKRIGKDGKEFRMLKFRTLVIGAEENIGGRLLNDGENLVTPIGRILRRLKLDELAQLINILKGDMGFVGPRPVRPLIAEKYSMQVPNYYMRFESKPGLTGLAQLRGGYYCNPKRKTRYDIFYIKKRTLLLDIKLISLTALRMIFSPGCLKSGDRPIGAAKSFESAGEENYRENTSVPSFKDAA